MRRDIAASLFPVSRSETRHGGRFRQESGTHQTLHRIVDGALRQPPGTHQILQLPVRADRAVGHRQIGAGAGRNRPGPNVAPVGQDNPRHPVIILQQVGQEITVVADEYAVHPVGCGHRAPCAPFDNGGAERSQIKLMQCPFADVGGDEIAVLLLIVCQIVLDRDHHVAALHSTHIGGSDLSR